MWDDECFSVYLHRTALLGQLKEASRSKRSQGRAPPCEYGTQSSNGQVAKSVVGLVVLPAIPPMETPSSFRAALRTGTRNEAIMSRAERNLYVQVLEAIAMYAFFRRSGEDPIVAYTRTAIVTCNDGACSRLRNATSVHRISARRRLPLLPI